MKTAKYILLVLLVLIMSVLYITRWRIQTVDQQTSPDGTYTLTLQQKGDPEWPFGPVYGRLLLKEQGNLISQTPVSAGNDGTDLTPGNWIVDWQEDMVVVVIRSEEGEDNIYRLSYGGEVQEVEPEDPSKPEEKQEPEPQHSEPTPILESDLHAREYESLRAFLADSGLTVADWTMVGGAKTEGKAVFSSDGEQYELAFHERDDQGRDVFVLLRTQPEDRAGIVTFYAVDPADMSITDLQRTHW
ncbi:MAG: hypothetical protein IKB65_00200 [Ruminiclostridium sp.]|nr:hypothetical protein [Ruminiclostridium sp.]